MKLTWLGGASVLLEFDNLTVLVNPKDTAASPRPDAVIATNLGYSDTDVLGSYAEGGAAVICPESVYNKISEHDGAVLLAPHSVWSERGITFYSVRAESADRTAIGVIIDDSERTFYIAGGTLYNFDVIDDCLDLAPDGVDLAILPISGKRCTMNARDAADFAYEIGAKSAVPVDYDPTSDAASFFDFDDAMLPTPELPIII